MAGTTRLNSQVDTPYTIRTLTFNSGAGQFVLSGSTLSVQGVGAADSNAILNDSANLQTINNNITMLGAGAFYAGAGDMTINGNIAINGNGVRFTASSNRVLTLNGIVSGTTGNSVSFNNSGTVVVNGVNTYTAKTQIWNGTVLVGANSLQTSGAFGDVSTLADKNLYLGASSGGTAISLLTNGAFQIDRQIVLVSNTNNSYVIGGATADNSSFTQNIRMGDSSLASSISFTAAAGGTVSITGNIVHPGSVTTGLENVSKIGAGTVVLSGTGSNYTGSTSINQGVLAVAKLADGGTSSSIGASSNSAGNLVLNGGTLRYTGSIATTDRLFSVGTGGGTIEANGSGAVTFNNTGALGFNAQTGGRTLALSGSNSGNNSLSVAIGDNSGATSVTKNGTGKWILSGSSSYSGGTTVSAGTLLINNTVGSGAGTGNVDVNGGALGGTGSFTGALTINSGGSLLPGASIESLGTGTLTMNDASTFGYEVDSSTALSVGADLLKVTGGLNLNGTVTLTLSDYASISPTAFAFGTTFTLINYDLNAWNNGLFTYGGNTIADGGTFTAGLNTWQLDYDATTGGSNFTSEYDLGGSFVNIVAVPEPNTILMAVGAGMLFLLGGVYRRRAN